MRACQLAGLTEMPAIVRYLDRHEAIISMVDANLKRENISPMHPRRTARDKGGTMQMRFCESANE